MFRLEESDNNDMPALINFLKTNGYDLEHVSYNPRGDTGKAIFSKMTHIAELDGNDINDATINIEIEFDARFDYKNAVYDEDEGFIYDFNSDKVMDYIKKLINGTYENAKGAKGNGKRKTRKNMKTRKNRKK